MTSNSSNNQHEGSTSNTTNYQQDRYLPLINSIESKFNSMEMAPIRTSKYCIYKAPKSIREVNEAAYTPRVISIGPFHRNKDELQTMEKRKVRYLHGFLEKQSQVSLGMLVTEIKRHEESVRQCYAEYIELSSDEFVEMIILDGFFIVEYLVKFSKPLLRDDDYMFIYRSKLGDDIWHDLILLENQLPFFILEILQNIVYPRENEDNFFLTISCSYFSYFNKREIIPEEKVLHFTDMIRTFYLPSKPRLAPTRTEAEIEKISYSLTELHKAGLTFVASSSKCLFDITFTPNGVLEIPQFGFEDRSESLFRNIMIFEQYHYQVRSYICNYIALMDKLIDTGKDVELLVRKGILTNWLGDHDVLATVINNLNREILHYDDEPYFSKLYEDVDNYYNYRWHSWKAILIRDHCSNPWKIASIVAATILIILTLMQTITSFLSLKKD